MLVPFKIPDKSNKNFATAAKSEEEFGETTPDSGFGTA